MSKKALHPTCASSPSPIIVSERLPFCNWCCMSSSTVAIGRTCGMLSKPARASQYSCSSELGITGIAEVSWDIRIPQTDDRPLDDTNDHWEFAIGYASRPPRENFASAFRAFFDNETGRVLYANPMISQSNKCRRLVYARMLSIVYLPDQVVLLLPVGYD